MPKYGQVMLLVVGMVVLSGTAQSDPFQGGSEPQQERGRYLVRIAGCNDCHTPGYAESGGLLPEARWLVGDKLGWHGPWGTTYPTNLRLFAQSIFRR